MKRFCIIFQLILISIAISRAENSPSPYTVKYFPYNQSIAVTFAKPQTALYLTNSLKYEVYDVGAGNETKETIKRISVSGGTTANGCYQGVAIYGTFSTSNKLVVTYPDNTTAPLNIVITNGPLLSGKYGTLTGTIQPFGAAAASGTNGTGLGIQYQLDYAINVMGDNSAENYLLYLHASSKGQLALASGSSTTNAIQDSVSAELDLHYVRNFYYDNWLGDEKDLHTEDSSGLGIMVSPVGFEYNKQFTIGSYTPSFAVGGDLPLLDYPARFWRMIWQNKGFNINNGSQKPILFSGISYISPMTGHITDPQAALVRERWDTQFIYDFPICGSADSIGASFRFSWNSYVGVNSELWAHYYQVGVVLTGKVISPNSGSGVFVGYTSGEQPPNFTRTSAWQLGYSLKF